MEQAAKKTGNILPRIILGVVLLIAICFVVYVTYTDSGKLLLNRLTGGEDGSMSVKNPKEQAAAKEIEKLGGTPQNEPPDQRVTSLRFNPDTEKKIDPKVFDHLPALFRINSIDFSNMELTNEQISKLDKNPSLSGLVISGTKIDDKGMAVLEKLPKLQSLILENTAVTDAGLVHLAKLPNLAVLDIAGTKVTDAGMKTLADLPKLNHLVIRNTAVTDLGIQEFSRSPKLGLLSHENTTITPEGIEKLRKALGPDRQLNDQ